MAVKIQSGQTTVTGLPGAAGRSMVVSSVEDNT